MGRGEGKIATPRFRLTDPCNCAWNRAVLFFFSRKRSNFRHFLQSKFPVGSGLVFNELKRSSDE